ncbi:MAG: glycosyltransferase [Chitinophagaceae bacterium]|nr:glycosyltransferase [Chitinophagaceae bacterium]
MMDKTLSIILLSYYSKTKLNVAVERLSEVLSQNEIPFEIIIMDDGSRDESYAIACALEEKYSYVKAYQLSRNYTSHYSVFAGLTLCSGACAAPVADDEQQPYETLVEMYRLWEKGNKVIIPFRNGRDDPYFSRMMSLGFYTVMNRLSDIKFPKYGADTFFIDREVIDILNERIHPIRTTTITEILRLGFSAVFVPYFRPLGVNEKSRWTLKKKINLAKDFFFSSSMFPIALITRLGMFFSAFSIALILFYFFGRLFGSDTEFWSLKKVPGWTSTVIIISFFSGLILFSLGIIAEYIWRIFEEVKGRPGFIIRKKEKK